MVISWLGKQPLSPEHVQRVRDGDNLDIWRGRGHLGVIGGVMDRTMVPLSACILKKHDVVGDAYANSIRWEASLNIFVQLEAAIKQQGDIWGRGK